ncbi:hypothetical protein BJ742DRAFT_668315, partial [Cladochytrium replicatum]
VLEWWKRKGFEILWPQSASIDGAIRFGHVDVLDWWKRIGDRGSVSDWLSGFVLKYDSRAMDTASSRCHRNVLELWRASGLELKWTRTQENASAAGYIALLEWWNPSGLDLK